MVRIEYNGKVFIYECEDCALEPLFEEKCAREMKEFDQTREQYCYTSFRDKTIWKISDCKICRYRFNDKQEEFKTCKNKTACTRTEKIIPDRVNPFVFSRNYMGVH